MIVLAKERLWRICKVGACSRVSSGFKLWHKLAWCGKKECGKSYLGSRSKRNPCTSQLVLRAVRQSHKDVDVPHKIWKMIIAMNMLYPRGVLEHVSWDLKREKRWHLPLSGVRDDVPKKAAVLLDFVQITPLPPIWTTFTTFFERQKRRFKWHSK